MDVQQATDGHDDEEQQLLRARGQLQVIESGIKLHQRWAARKHAVVAVQELMAGLATLLSFCAADPAIELSSMYMLDVHHQVLCCDPVLLGK